MLSNVTRGELARPELVEGVEATVADILRPCGKTQARLYDTAVILCGSLLIALAAQAKIVLPFSPVPITGQTFAVLMLGALLGARRGALCVLVYLAEGALGLPVFAGGVGVAALVGPTAGYLAGFVAAACLVGLLAERGWDRRVGTTILAMVLGNITIHVFGVVWLSFLMGVKAAMAVGTYPFIIGDILKILLAAAILPAGWRLLRFAGVTDRR